MRKLGLIIGLALVAIVGWYFIWNSLMTGQVAQVESSVAHHYRAIKDVVPTATFKSDEVYATGFPFHFRVAVERPTLTQVWGDETYAISFDKIELERVNEGEGRYRVLAPASFDAMYAQAGNAPEQYRITVNEMPAMLLRATGDSRRCSNLPGSTRCEAKPGDPLISFAAQLPRRLVLDVSLNGKTKQIGFDLVPLNVPVFAAIPAQVSHPLQIFVGMLREAMVFQK